MLFAVTVMREAALSSLAGADAVDALAVGVAGVAAGAVLAEAVGFSVAAAGVALAEAAGFSGALAVVVVAVATWGVVAVATWVAVALLLAAGWDGAAGVEAGAVAGLSSAMAVEDDRKRGAPAFCDDESDGVASGVAAGVPAAPFTSVPSTSSSPHSPQPSFLPFVFTTTVGGGPACAVWVLPP